MAALYYIFAWLPLQLLRAAESIIKYLGYQLSWDLFFDQKGNLNGVTGQWFLYTALISAGIFFIIFFMMLIKAAFLRRDKSLFTYKQLIKHSTSGFLAIIVIPGSMLFIFFVLNWILTTVIGFNSKNVSTLIYESLYPAKLTPSQESINSFAFLSIADFAQLQYGQALLFIIQILIISVMMFFFYKSVGTTIIKNAFTVVLTFIISPFVVQTIIVDGGQRLARWKNQLLTPLVSTLILLLSLRIVLEITFSTFGYLSNLEAVGKGTLRSVWSLLIMMIVFSAAFFTVFKTHQYVIHFIIGEPNNAVAEPKKSIFTRWRSSKPDQLTNKPSKTSKLLSALPVAALQIAAPQAAAALAVSKPIFNGIKKVSNYHKGNRNVST